jgi:hypothetical protein
MSDYLSIEIPDRLQELVKDSEIINSLKSKAEEICCKGMEYFNEYTRHDCYHINEVLKYVVKLIDEKTNINQKAAEALICAVIIHDIGMYIRPTGVKKLLTDPTVSERKMEHFSSSRTWKEEFESFYKSARQKDKNLEPDWREFIKKIDDFKESDKAVIGEFLRRFHHRLAYEFCVYGSFLGDDTVQLVHTTDKDLKEIIGIVAYSHGINIRDTDKFIIQTFHNNIKPKRIPIHFLMCLLRVADYLDASDVRAPQTWGKIEPIKNEISKKEFEWNQKIDDINFKKNDRTIEIKTKDIDNSIVYTKIEEWYNSLSRELDMCWAVISEHQNEYDYHYLMSIHRISIDIVEEKTKDTYNNFVPKRIVQKVNPDIVKKLINPLYIDEDCGLREMLQNAVDACNAKSSLVKGYTGHIEVNFDKKNNSLLIKDDGIGMSIDVIENYFLVVGSSYRNSDEFAELFTEDGIKPKALRTGYFGIGSLAPFMLGETISVKTNPYNEKEIFSFSYDFNNSDPINIKVEKNENNFCGTEITIKLFNNSHILKLIKSIIDRVQWGPGSICFDDERNILNYYLWDSPSIQYKYNDKSYRIHNSVRMIIPKTEKPNEKWYRYVSKDYGEIIWQPLFDWGSYNLKRFMSDCYYIVCNGIYVGKEDYHSDNDYKPVFPIVISLIDDKHRIQYNLSRTKIINYTIENDFSLEISKFYLASFIYYIFYSDLDLFIDDTYISNINSYIEDKKSVLYRIIGKDKIIKSYDGLKKYLKEIFNQLKIYTRHYPKEIRELMLNGKTPKRSKKGNLNKARAG